MNLRTMHHISSWFVVIPMLHTYLNIVSFLSVNLFWYLWRSMFMHIRCHLLIEFDRMHMKLESWVFGWGRPIKDYMMLKLASLVKYKLLCEWCIKYMYLWGETRVRERVYKYIYIYIYIYILVYFKINK